MVVFSCLFRKCKPKVIFSSPYIPQDYKHKTEVVQFYLWLQQIATYLNKYGFALDLNKYLQNKEVRSQV